MYIYIHLHSKSQESKKTWKQSAFEKTRFISKRVISYSRKRDDDSLMDEVVRRRVKERDKRNAKELIVMLRNDNRDGRGGAKGKRKRRIEIIEK